MNKLSMSLYGKPTDNNKTVKANRKKREAGKSIYDLDTFDMVYKGYYFSYRMLAWMESSWFILLFNY